MTESLTVRYLGGPTAVLETGGLRLLVDPTFDAAGGHPVGDRVLTKTMDAVAGPDEVGPVDADDQVFAPPLQHLALGGRDRR